MRSGHVISESVESTARAQVASSQKRRTTTRKPRWMMARARSLQDLLQREQTCDDDENRLAKH